MLDRVETGEAGDRHLKPQTNTYKHEHLFVGGRVLLGVGLLQQSAPELSAFSRVDEQQLAIFDWQLVVDHHVHPLPKLPELQSKKENQSPVTGVSSSSINHQPHSNHVHKARFTGE